MPSTDVHEAGPDTEPDDLERPAEGAAAQRPAGGRPTGSADRGGVLGGVLGGSGPLPRRLRAQAGQLKRRLVRVTRVRFVGWDTVEVSVAGGVRRRRYRLSDPAVGRKLRGSALYVAVPDPAALDRLAGSGLFAGVLQEIRVRVATMPAWLRGGIRFPRTARDSTTVDWRTRGVGLEVRLGWRRKRAVGRAFDDVSTALLRPGRWESCGGPVFPIVASAPRPSPPVLATAIANPQSRRLLGAAARYQLSRDGSGRIVLRTDAGRSSAVFDPSRTIERALLDSDFERYAVATVPPDLADGDGFVDAVLVALAGCGVVLTTADSRPGRRLDELGLATVADPAEVDGLAGYQHSARASRLAALAHDPALRRTRLADPAGELPLPTISVLIASKRPDDIPVCLADLATQSYPEFEVVLGTHGYQLPPDRLVELRDQVPVPLRSYELPAEYTLGQVLGALSRHADGELLSKVDDDDRYAPDHLTDLFLASRTSGADLVAKSARFVYLADGDVTIDRTWAAAEAFQVTPAGGTLLFSRGVLQAAGGWSMAPRHVDADLVKRIGSIGGLTYRTHGLGYLYVRHGAGHTWQAETADLLAHGEISYAGLPPEVLA